MIAAYREPDRSRGRELMTKLIYSRPADSGHNYTLDREGPAKVQAAALRTAEEQSRSYRALGHEVLQIESIGRT